LSQLHNQASTASPRAVAEARADLDTPSGPQAAVASAHAVRVGRVVAVSGSQVITLLETGAGHSADTPKMQIGTLIKMETPISTVFGMVSGLSIPIPKQDAGDAELNIIEMELVGETMKGASAAKQPFQRGVSIFPTLGDSVYMATKQDLERVYAPPAVDTVRIGTIHQDEALPAFVGTDNLLGKHFAILGTTGSGKSCAVALILQSILKRHQNAHILLLDPHDEYAHAFGDMAEALDPSNLKLPYWLFTFEEITEVILGDNDQSRKAEAAILNEAICEAKRKYMLKSDANAAAYVTTDTPVPYQISELLQIIDEAMGKLDNPENSAPYLRLKSRINALRVDSRFGFMFGGLGARDNMSDVLARLFRIPVAGRPITIVDLSGVPSEIINVVVSVLSRMMFDFAVWSDRALPMLLVCEEAHRYVPQDTSLGFEPTKKSLSRIAKEGRKYGVSLCVVSQRPSELAAGILSQCNTIFALRMSNQKDQEFVRGALSESAMGLMEFLPSMRNAEAIAVGEGVPVPVRLCFDELPEERRPLSGTARFSSAWQTDGEDKSFIDTVVDRWRRQRR
jgi:DNA helicase HerA-like ATPase